MKFSSFLWKLLLVYLILQLGLAVIFVVVSSGQNRRLSEARLEHELSTAAYGLLPALQRLLATQPLDSDQLVQLIKKFAEETGIRVTVTDGLGNVLSDSSRPAAEMENHLNRTEFIQASLGQLGKATRLSESTGEEYQYLAVPTKLENRIIGYLRVAVPTAPIRGQLWLLTESAAWLALISAAAVTAIMFILAKSLTSPLHELLVFSDAVSRGDYNHRLSRIASRGEWAPLAEGFDHMQVELERRERALVENNDRLAAVLMSMNEGVISIDDRRRVVLANRASIHLLGLPDQDLAQRPFFEIVRNPVVEKCVEDVFETHQTVTREFEFIRPSRRILAMRVTWLAQQTGEAVVVVVHDVTNLRQLETMRRDFVANVSHELKTPLSSIKAYSETLRLGAIYDESNRMRFVERIEEQATRLNDIIMDLLKLARIESGQAAIEVEDVDLCQVAAMRVKAFEGDATKRRIELTFESTKPKIIVRSDDEGIATILDNLISNAVRYSPEGGTVEVRISSDQSMGILEVIDNGLGIAPEYHERIFERFYRVDKARSSDLGGTGLGLSIVKHLAQSFAGSVSLSSRLGKGTRFTVKIPLA